jgi:hypothetical protein
VQIRSVRFEAPLLPKQWVRRAVLASYLRNRHGSRKPSSCSKSVKNPKSSFPAARRKQEIPSVEGLS